jgi:hypothetical protein
MKSLSFMVGLNLPTLEGVMPVKMDEFTKVRLT